MSAHDGAGGGLIETHGSRWFAMSPLAIVIIEVVRWVHAQYVRWTASGWPDGISWRGPGSALPGSAAPQNTVPGTGSPGYAGVKCGVSVTVIVFVVVSVSWFLFLFVLVFVGCVVFV